MIVRCVSYAVICGKLSISEYTQQKEKFWMVADYGSTDLKDLEATKPHKKEKRPPTISIIVVLLQGVMQVGGFTAKELHEGGFKERTLQAVGRRAMNMRPNEL